MEIIYKETCSGYWNCLGPSDWIQLISVMIAMLAAVASYISVIQTRKQFREESEDRRKKYRPYFKIRSLNENEPKKFVFEIINEGFPYYVFNQIEWKGTDGITILEHFNAQMERKRNNQLLERYESFIVYLFLENIDEGEGWFEISGFDIEHNEFRVKSPLIKIKDNDISNDVELTYQYLR